MRRGIAGQKICMCTASEFWTYPRVIGWIVLERAESRPQQNASWCLRRSGTYLYGSWERINQAFDFSLTIRSQNACNNRRPPGLPAVKKCVSIADFGNGLTHRDLEAVTGSVDLCQANCLYQRGSSFFDNTVPAYSPNFFHNPLTELLKEQR